MVHRYEMELAGRRLVVESGRLARQAHGAAMVRFGDTVVNVTACVSAEPRPGIDFFPLTVDYEERLYAVGRIPGSFFRREGRPTEKAILSARLTDRPIRPLFPRGFRNDVQVIVTVLSVDYDAPQEFCGLLGASLALSLSEIPWHGPIGAVIVGRVGGEFVINPTQEQQNRSDLHLVVAGTRDAILMVEAGADQVPEDAMLDAIMFGHETIKELVAFQESIIAEIGKPKAEFPVATINPDLEAAVREYVAPRLKDAVLNPDKLEREAQTRALEAETLEHFSELFPEDLYPGAKKQIAEVFTSSLKAEVRQLILDRRLRPDGRRPDEIRPVSVEVGLVPRVHGSGLFTRGQTQALTIATLGAVSDRQILDSLQIEEFKRYMHHYNFPPYSVGETRPLRGPGRREVGHGALAERALAPVIPDEETFPYTIRLVSEVLESNGSTSMASVCGSTLALMDAGVPIRAPVAGIAMGLVKEGDRVAVLTDIQGIEDALGDMDFKVAGTRQGVTALQMDIKIGGVGRAVLEQALEQARQARLHILDRMLEVLPEPRPELSPYAPRIIVLQIDPDKIRHVIGPGGKMIHKITAECNVEIDIEDDGRIFIAAHDGEGGKKAVEWIQSLTREVEPGQIYRGTVTRLMNFGAFVELVPGKEGLIHISELAEGRVPTVEDVVEVGDKVLVKVTEIDRLGRINLSRREALKDANGEQDDPAIRLAERGVTFAPAGPPEQRGGREPGGDRRPRFGGGGRPPGGRDRDGRRGDGPRGGRPPR